VDLNIAAIHHSSLGRITLGHSEGERVYTCARFVEVIDVHWRVKFVPAGLVTVPVSVTKAPFWPEL